jgi:predicted nucleotide-binding protein (sugar kinase/HSP70/actin superfamily)
MKKNKKQANTNRVLFTREMRESGYTILVPTMLPRHFRMMARMMGNYGYRLEVLRNTGRDTIESGLKYVHNDTCYPAQIVIGQFIRALESGEYDPKKTALLFTQTGGGCRASNYISLLRKALEKAGFGYVPVISINFSGLESNPGFKLTLPILRRMVYAVLYGDLIMLLENQCRPYELNPGDSLALSEKLTVELGDQLGRKGALQYSEIRRTFAEIVKAYRAIPRSNEKKLRVGIVGEIFVKFSPLANNSLEQFLIDEGAEPVVPGFVGFAQYCVYNMIMDRKLYGMGRGKMPLFRFAHRLILKKQDDMIRAVRENSDFMPPPDFRETIRLVTDCIGLGVKMGEGWLLPGEMLDLVHAGVRDIVCTQPFGCLPNHIVGKGMMKPIRAMHPGANIVAVDYDAGATVVNQQNRIKLMLANARERDSMEAEEKKDPTAVI